MRLSGQLFYRTRAVPETPPFEEWPLHDAVVGPFTLDVESETCALELDVFFERGEDARPARVEWDGVTGFTLGLAYGWGRSSFASVNRQWRDQSGVYVIELQTGDEVRVTARSARLQDPRAVEPATAGRRGA